MATVNAFGGNVPYKWMDFSTENCPADEACKDTVMICGKCIHNSEMGNILFAGMARMLLSESGVNRGISRIGKNGPDKPEDMAGVIGGYILTPSLKKGSITTETLCELLNSDSSAHLPALDEFPQLAQHKDKLTKNSLKDMSAKYQKCKKCPDAAPNLPHSDLSAMHAAENVGVLSNKNRWRDVYQDLNVQWPAAR